MQSTARRQQAGENRTARAIFRANERSGELQLRSLQASGLADLFHDGLGIGVADGHRSDREVTAARCSVQLITIPARFVRSHPPPVFGCISGGNDLVAAGVPWPPQARAWVGLAIVFIHTANSAARHF